jgi:hypothetical protein
MGWRELVTNAQRTWVRTMGEGRQSSGSVVERVIVHLEGEADTELDAIFDSQFVNLTLDVERDVAAQETRVDLIEADLPRRPRQWQAADYVEIPRLSVNMYVRILESDGQGMLSLVLTTNPPQK